MSLSSSFSYCCASLLLLSFLVSRKGGRVRGSACCDSTRCSTVIACHRLRWAAIPLPAHSQEARTHGKHQALLRAQAAYLSLRDDNLQQKTLTPIMALKYPYPGLLRTNECRPEDRGAGGDPQRDAEGPTGQHRVPLRGTSSTTRKHGVNHEVAHHWRIRPATTLMYQPQAVSKGGTSPPRPPPPTAPFPRGFTLECVGYVHRQFTGEI